MDKPELPLYSTDVIYRPPKEEESAFLEISTGCSWHKCAFCDFIRDDYKVFALDEIEQKARLLKERIGGSQRLFLLGQNSFSLNAAYLTEVFGIIKRHLPGVLEISMYARADDINRKTLSELSFFREMGLKELHVGVESGCDRVLSLVNKGVSANNMIKAFNSLDKTGINYSLTSILGLGGRPLWREHAIETARFYNSIHPLNIWCLALKLWPGTPLHHMAQTGAFEPMTYREMLIEERLMLSHMEDVNCNFTDTTALGKYTLKSRLPEGRQSLIDAIDYLLEKAEDSVRPD